MVFCFFFFWGGGVGVVCVSTVFLDMIVSLMFLVVFMDAWLLCFDFFAA